MKNKCPECKKDIRMKPRTYIFMSNYDKSYSHAKTMCCGSVITVEREVSFKFNSSDKKVDDWGEHED